MSKIDSDFEKYVKSLDDNIDGFSTITSEDSEHIKESGVVFIIENKMVVLLKSQLKNIVDFLDKKYIY